MKNKYQMKIAHSIDALDQGEVVILTLKDQPLTKGYDLNQDIQELENIQIREKQQTEYKNYLKQNLKKLAHADTSHLSYKLEGKGDTEDSLLPHYNQHKYKNQGFTIQRGQEQQFIVPKSVFETIKQQKEAENILLKQNKVASEYESGQKKKIKPRKVADKTKKTKELINFLEQTIEQDVELDNKKRKAAEHIEESLQTLRKKRNFERAMEKAVIENKMAQQKMKDFEEYELQLALQRQKRKVQKQLEPVNKLLEENLKHTHNEQNTVQIDLDPLVVASKNVESSQQQQKTSNVLKLKDVRDGAASVVNVSLPSERLMKQRQQVTQKIEQLPQSMEQITQQQLERMKKQISFMEEEDLGVGLSGVLKFLRQRNGAIDEEGMIMPKSAKLSEKKSTQEDRIKLQYRDAKGRLMNPRQAFRYMCWIFHGQGPGKNKIEKLKKRQLLNEKIKSTTAGETPFMKVLKQHQIKTQQPHMFINRSTK